MTTWVRLLTLAILFGIGAGQSWSASAPEPWGPMGQIEAAARKEAKLVIYAAPGHANSDTQRAVSQHFQQKYGIAIDWTGIDARDIAPRVLAEQRTKQYVADLIMTGLGGACTPVKAAGYVAPILAPSTFEKGVWRLEPLAAAPTERDWAYLFMPLIPSFFINTNLVPPGEEPKGYQDLLHPKWKGKIVLQTPAVGGSGSGWFRATYKALGLDYLRKLAGQVVIVPQVNDVPDQVSRGQYAIGLGASTGRGRELVREGAPVRFLWPQEGPHLSYIGTCALSPVVHPNAAKLFLNWLYTQEGQLLYTKPMNAIPLRKDVPQDHVAPNERYIEGRPFLAAEVEDLTDKRSLELYALGKQIFEEKK